MNIEDVRDYCIQKMNATESTPFDETTLVYKVENKMFALLSLEEDQMINLKSDPEYAIELREHYNFIKPGYHMNKLNWNSIKFNDCPTKLLLKLIDDSYNLIIEGLPKKIKINYL
jgi:predicted DNA-binding protein (MmcQ/YjbR family)